VRASDLRLIFFHENYKDITVILKYVPLNCFGDGGYSSHGFHVFESFTLELLQLLLFFPLLLHVDPFTSSFLFLILPIMGLTDGPSIDPESNILPLFGYLCPLEILFYVLRYLFILTCNFVMIKLQAPSTPDPPWFLLYPDLFHMPVDDYW